ncbi:MAG: hypothetical protein K2H41_07290 [Acetatifactor sp.]|nr:hypothetical protein [Acetatifactor sp.]
MQKNNGISNFERKFGKYAIPNLSLILVMCYVAGYVLFLVNPNFMNYLTLDPYQILHGQIWRVFTWIISPPSDLSVFTLVMLFFYYSIGTSLERTWGTYRYNVYIFGGMLITVIASFLCMGVCYLLFGAWLEMQGAVSFFSFGAWMFSTYYINMSIFLAYAVTYPEHQVLLMFVIPVKVKWLGIIYGVMLVIGMVQSFMAGLSYHPAYWFGVVAIGASLINFLIFWIQSRRLSYLNPRQIKRKVHFQHQVREGVRQSGHKCCICGRTEQDDPALEFRYCSKCAGNHEYCQQHLFTHEHKV